MFKKNDIVTIKPEWRNPGEDDSDRYRIIRDEEKGRVDMVLLNSGMKIDPVETVNVETIQKVAE